jgi:ferredoxin
MRVAVDLMRCEGHGLCADAAPELFTVDENGQSVVLATDGVVPPEQERVAAEAVHSCPVGALRAG